MDFVSEFCQQTLNIGGIVQDSGDSQTVPLESPELLGDRLPLEILPG